MSVQEILAELKDACNSDNIALVSRDGLALAYDTSEGVFAETFSIMCATILGAAVTTTSELTKGEPEMIVITTAKGTVLISGISKQSLIVMSVPKSANLDIIKDEVAKAAAKLKAQS